MNKLITTIACLICCIVYTQAQNKDNMLSKKEILPWKVKCANVYLTTVLSLIQDKMFFILVYLKTNPLQELHAIQFEMTQPQANRWIHLLSEILRRTLKTLGELPDRNSKRLIHILQGCEEVLLDGTERPIQRPLDEDWQSACYSGKKNS